MLHLLRYYLLPLVYLLPPIISLLTTYYLLRRQQPIFHCSQLATCKCASVDPLVCMYVYICVYMYTYASVCIYMYRSSPRASVHRSTPSSPLSTLRGSPRRASTSPRCGHPWVRARDQVRLGIRSRDRVRLGLGLAALALGLRLW